MRKSLPGLARGMRDAQLGSMDEWLEPAAAHGRLREGLLAGSNCVVAALHPEYVRWKPSAGLVVVWLAILQDGAVLRATEKVFPTLERAEVAEHKSRTRSLVDAKPLRAMARVASGRSLWLAFPNDRELFALPRWTDPSRAKHALAEGVAHLAEGQIRVRGRATRIDVIRYKPERRAVLRIDAGLADDRTGGRRREVIFARVLPRETARMLSAALRSLSTAQARCVALLGFHEETSTILQEAVSGRTADELGADAEVHRKAGTAVSGLHRADLTESLPRFSGAARLAETSEEAIGLAEAVDSRWSERVRALVSKLSTILPSTAEAPVVVHGDFHPGQCVLQGEEVALLDLDSIGVDVPERDAGHYLAALAARRTAGLISERTFVSATEAFRHGFGAFDPNRLAFEESLALLEHALSPLRRLEASGVEMARELVEQAHGRLALCSKRPASERSLVPLPWRDATERVEALHRALPSLGRLREVSVVRGSARESGSLELELRVLAESGLSRTVFAKQQGAQITQSELGAIFSSDLLRSLVARALRVPRPRVTAVESVLLAARAGRRATLRLDATLSGGERPRLVLRWTPTARSMARAEWAQRLAATAAMELPFAAPLVVDGDAHVAVYPFVDGTDLAHLLDAGSPMNPAAIVSAIDRFHSLEAPPNAERHGASEELATLDRVRRRSANCGIPEPEGFEAARQLLEERVGDFGSGADVLLHRDLYERQILVGPRGKATLLDLDTAALGDAALDAGNFLAHLDLRAMEHAEGVGEAVLRQALWALPRAEERAIRWAAAATLLRLAFVHSLRTPASGSPARLATALTARAKAHLLGSPVGARG
ncbi:MAG: hypothetical protein JNJ88_16800 [Planctomycetes bacterium]|nr:hypothetical protein [Planctomycetota bacterium]